MSWLMPLADPSVFPWLCFVVGACIGSFLNVVVYRLPKMMEADWRAQCAELRGEAPAPSPPFNLLWPGSACPRCGHAIRMWENLPIVSWVALRGRCASCHAPINPRYPAVELLTGLLSAYVGWRYGAGVEGAAILLLCWSLVALTFIDVDTKYLPDSVTLPLLWAGLLVNVQGTFVPLSQAVIGATVGYLSLWTVYWGFKWITGKEGMGYGDFKLLAALGAWLGWKMLLPIVLLSSILGAIVGMALILLARHGRQVPIPFGPYLALAGVVALFWGQPVLRAYLPFLL